MYVIICAEELTVARDEAARSHPEINFKQTSTIYVANEAVNQDYCTAL